MPPPTGAASEEIRTWFVARLPRTWFLAPAEVTVDRDEILVNGPIAAPEAGDPQAVLALVKRFREASREGRLVLAHEAEHRFGRKVSWAVTCGSEQFVFAHLAVPVMTRLRMEERAVLDTLIDAGVARSRSEALAWCVRLVGRHQGEWITQLRQALVAVEEARAAGPDR